MIPVTSPLRRHRSSPRPPTLPATLSPVATSASRPPWAPPAAWAGRGLIVTSRPSISRVSSLSVIPLTGSPAPVTLPSRSTVTLPACATTSSSRWLTSRTDVPSAARSCRIDQNSCWMCRGRAWVASSKTMHPCPAVWVWSARAIATTARCPAVSPATGASGSMATPSRSKVAVTASLSADRLMRRLSRRTRNWPIRTLSSTDALPTRPRSWWTNDRPSSFRAATRTGGPSEMPFTRKLVPGSAGWNPDSSLMSVDFPEPFCPTSAWISPGAI